MAMRTRVQAKRLPSAGAQQNQASAPVRRAIGGGASLPQPLRHDFEKKFGYDFSHVRVHTDADASESANSLSARAYTLKKDIVFNSGEYQPSSPSGRRLLAHELSHVVQQGDSPRRGADSAMRHMLPGRSNALTVHGNAQISREVSDAGPGEEDAGPGPEHLIEQVACIRRLGGCPQTRPGGIPTEEEIRQYGATCASETGYAGPALVAQDLGCEATEAAQDAPASAPTSAPAQSPPTPMHVAGQNPPDQPYKIIRIAWTLDDGPTAFTAGMQQALGPIGGTWFIVRSALGQGTQLQQRLGNMRTMQDQQNQEFGIHTMHQTESHGAWFPVRVSRRVQKIYNTMAEAMQDLTDFTAVLRGANLSIHFVRITGGLISELMAYLGHLGVPESNRRPVANQIIQGQNIATTTPAALPVQQDYQTLQTTLTGLGLHLWGGGAGTPETSRQSWEAESSGSGLTDNVTQVFNDLVDAFGRVHRPRSLIVLAHDVNQANATEVGRDIAAMEAYAQQHNVLVEYYTLSDLYRIVRGQEP